MQWARAMKILHLEDCQEDAELVAEMIRREWPDCVITRVEARAPFVKELQQSRYDVVVSDFGLRSLNGLEALELAKTYTPDTPFIFLSGTIGEDRAIDALRSGAQDYILKDGMKRLVSAIARALRDSDERHKRREAETRSRELANCLNQAHEAVVVTDLEGRITFWNQGAERLSGWSAAQAVDKRFD